MIKKLMRKLKNWFKYSHYLNKKKFENQISNFLEFEKAYNNIYIKVVSDFRNAHMNIIAWMIAFLWFINKDWIATNIDLKIWIILLLVFIFMSIISIVLSYYYDYFWIKAIIKYINGYIKVLSEAKQNIEKLDFTKEQALQINKKMKEFNPPKNEKIWYFIVWFTLLTWLVLLLWLFFIIKFYISK